jgi:putative endonuclease
MYYFYTIKSQKNGSLYKGISADPEKRLEEHNAGKTRSTKAYRPYVIVYTEDCGTRKKARDIEKYYKTGYGREKLESIIS